MTRTLILMRHAKSSWADLTQPDHDRPLNARGRKAALALGQWLRDVGCIPEEIISSTARRTIETCERLELSVEPVCTNTLYHASAEQMLNALHGAGAHCVLMLGHNPGIADFADRLLGKTPTHHRFFDYPSGATTIIDFEGENWKDVQFGTGACRDFVIPRELPAP